jgi:gamma-glutamylcyclotransferase (GGCT)/AIG2-like uncharacterized protein YtfP
MLIAVYGSLRKDLTNYNAYLKNSKYVGTYETKPIYTLKSLGYFPGLEKNGTTSIVMEVYRVDEETMSSIDRLEGYQANGGSNHYEKETIKTPFGDASIYFYAKPERIKEAPVVLSGDWKEYLKNKKMYHNA